MGPNPNAFFCGFPNGLAHVTVQVATSNPLSRHHPCRDIDLTSRHQLLSLQLGTGVFLCRDINGLSRHQLVSLHLSTGRFLLSRHQSLVTTSAHVSAAFNLFVPDVATSIPCRDFTLCPCNLQLVMHDVATSISCSDINLRNCNLQLSASIVATSISCRDINLCLWRLQLVVFGVPTSVLCHDIILSYISFILPTCHSFKALLLSRPPSLVATSTSVATSLCCRDIIL